MGSDEVRIVLANQASWDDLVAVFDNPGDPRRCWCQWFKTVTNRWSDNSPAQRRELLRVQTGAESPEAAATTGLVAYLGDEPAGWVAVEPRTGYERLRRARTVWQGRTEDKDDPGVWAITCFVVRPEYRGRGLMRALAAAAAEHARKSGASAVEGYPQVVEPGRSCPAGDLYVGTRQAFADAGFAQVSAPSATRAVMRIDF